MTVTEEVKKLCESARLAVPAVALAGDERRNAALIAAAVAALAVALATRRRRR